MTDLPEPPDDSEPATMMFVRRARDRDGADGSESYDDSWRELSRKVRAFLTRGFAGERFPPDREFEDLLSEVYSRMIDGLDRLELRTREEFWGWVRQIANNRLRDFWRANEAQKRGGGQTPLSLSGEDAIDIPDGSAETGSAVLRVQELESAESACVDQLKSKDLRDAYRLRRQGMGYAEIARQLEIEAPSLARLRYHRARKRVLECLRSRLDQYGLRIDSSTA